MSERARRSLKAILAADVVGYARLMGEDATSTLSALRRIRTEVFAPIVSSHDGSVVKSMGDGWLIAFDSAADAVDCGLKIQESLSADETISLRIGIHIGDVTLEDEDVFGDGVNIAARLQEEIAEPGAVVISEYARRCIEGKLASDFIELGPQELKNIAEPVAAFAWGMAKVTKSTASLTRPDKPSVAVLPFENMSGDPEWEYLSDGIAEDILTNLSQIHELFVIARNSSFSYKHEHPDLRKVAEQLGVQYILEGSVRPVGSRIRISAQLIDGINGSHVWADRFDRALSDIFELQDEITWNIATALQVRLTEGQQVNIRRNQTRSYPAWQAYQLAQFHRRRFTRSDNAIAREQATTALEHDPLFVPGLCLLALTYVFELRQPWNPDRDESIREASRIINRAMEINNENPEVWSALGDLLLLQSKHKAAEQTHRRALALGPNVADIHVFFALVLNMRNNPTEAIALIEAAMRLCPIFPDFYLGILGISYRLLRRYDDAIEADQRRLEMNPNNVFSDLRLAAVYAELGDLKLASRHVREALKKQPNYRISHLKFTDPYEDPSLMADYEELLRSAGLPD